MAMGHWFRSPRPLLAWFLAITVVLAGALGWLSWRLTFRFEGEDVVELNLEDYH